MFKNVLEISRKIYSNLADDYSKEIFMYRALYSTTGNIKPLQDMILTTKIGKKFIDKMNNSEKFIFFGAGEYGSWLCRDWKLEKCIGFIDNNKNKQGKKICGFPVYSFDEYLKNFDCDIFITTQTPKYNSEIKKQILDAGISENKIIDEINDNGEYFSLKELFHVQDETFVDIGVLDGNTSLDFIKWSNGNFKHIYCFEPDPRNFPVSKKNLSELINSEKLTIFNKGAWSENRKIKFNSEGNGSSHVDKEGEVEIEVVALDDVIGDKKITFIKMDVEGSEAEVIKGAKKIISEQKPKMAVCIYHKPEDFLELPALLLEYNSDYKFYMRHYSACSTDTILYAI